MLNLKTLSISLFIVSSIAIYIMYLKGENEALQVNLDIQRDLYRSTKQAYENALKYEKNRSTFEKENLNNIQNSIKAKEQTKQEDFKRGLVNEVSNSSFTIVSF